ncbi:MAG: hypothetical protein ACO1NO_09115 [Burkholderiaceae bacterium]
MNAQPNESSSRILIHAPTAGAVERARNNATNLVREMPDAQVHIIVNADGVPAVLDNPRADSDALTLVCSNTLKRIGREAAAPLQTVPSAILAIVAMQQDGWLYVRA